MFNYDLIADIYVLAFAAAQNVSRRQNEVLGDSHRPRLKTSISADENIDEDFNYEKEEEEERIELNEEQQQFSNNNNDQIYDLNNKLEKSPICVPVDAFPPSLIKWPLDNNPKRKRLADIRNQVKLLTNAIKMTIENDKNAPSGMILNPVPYSPHVNMASIKDHSGSSSTSNLPSLEDITTLLTAKRTKELKLLMRRSPWLVNDPIREKMWKVLCQNLTNEEFTDLYYWDTVQQIYGTKELSESHVVLPSFVDKHRLMSYGLSEEGVKTCNRVMSVVAYSYPDITFAPLLYPLTAIFMHYMEEPDVYNCISVLVSKGSYFISQTKTLYDCMWRTVKMLSKKHIGGSYLMLQKFSISEEQTNEGFQTWLWWLFAYLPLAHLVRVIDCFLLEGNKILIRCSMAVFHLFIRRLSRDSNLAAIIATKGFPDAIATFGQTFPYSCQKLLKSGFGIRALSKKEIKKILRESELSAKNHLEEIGFQETNLVRAPSLEGLPTSESQRDLQKSSHTFALKELLSIWSWLPMRMTMLHPTLIYTTEEHGSSLTTFFNRVDEYEQTLLVVRTSDDCVFGAYCSMAWGERKHSDAAGKRRTYFGTGETFLFTLRPKPIKYEWVGITKQRKDAHLSTMMHSEELFMHADNEMISVGGGHGHGLMLDHEMQTGKTESCETFANPPLCPEGNFDIKVVEVYGLTQT